MMGEGLLLFNGENLPEISRALMSFVSESCTRYMYLNLFLQNEEHFCFTFSNFKHFTFLENSLYIS